MIKAVIFDFYGVLNEGMEPNHRLLNLIENELKPKYKIGLLSNASDEFMYEIVPKAKIKKLFDNIIISYQVGVAKPEPEVYKLMLDNLSVQPAEAVFIDDLPKHTEPASKLGLKVILYKDFEQVKSELQEILAAGAGSDN